MFNFDFTYFFINIVLLGSFIYSGYRISKGCDYFKYSCICVIIFTLVLGLRYGRGNDYHHYVDIYVHGYNEGRQLVFTWINGLLSWLGVGRYSIFLFYSFIEIVCAMIFMKRYSRYAQYMLPWFLIATIFFDEYQIRQALGFSFVFLCLDRLFEINDSKQNVLKKENIKQVGLAVLYLILAYSIHSVCGYMLVIMIVLNCFYRRTIPLICSIPLLLFCTYFFTQWFDFSWLNPILERFVGDDIRMSQYLENREKWFSVEGMSDLYKRNDIVLVAEMLGTISLYILGSKVINRFYRRADAYAMYNFFVIGSIIQNAFRQLELLNRIGGDFALFWFFPLSLVLYYKQQLYSTHDGKKNLVTSLINPFTKKNAYTFWVVCLLWYVYNYFKYLFMRGDMIKFIWDT